MSSISVELLVILALLIANGLFAMSEMAVVSARKARLQQWSNQGNKRAQAALALANSPNQFLSTVQVGITLIGILAGAFGGATLSARLAGLLAQIPGLARYSQPLAFGSVVLLITYLSLIVGELVPKRLALNDPERVATNVAMPMGMVAKVTGPVVHLLSASTDLVLRLLGVQPSSEPLVTEEEIKVLLEQGTEAGMFEYAEQMMVERVFRLGDRRVSSLMTPRPEIVWLDLSDSWEVNRQRIAGSMHSRFPVCQDELDNVLGVVSVNDLLSRSLSGQSLDLTTMLRRPLFVPENTRALKVLELFKQSGVHIAMAVDEYGVIQGIVTLNDLLEAIIGDIPSKDEEETPQAVRREDGSWLIDGMIPIDEFRALFDLEEMPGEHRGNYHTLGGFVITHLGRIPVAADHFEWGLLRFEVMDMDGNRVDKVLVMPRNPIAEEVTTSDRASDRPDE